MITLPPFVITELYADTLVNDAREVVPVTSIDTDKTEVTATSYDNKSLGDNLKNILVVVNNPGIKNLPDSELDFLKVILAACKLSLADVAIVNLNNYPPASYKQLTTLFKSKIVLLFNVSPAEFGLPMNFPFYQIQPFAGASFLYAPSLAELEKDRAEKSRLWVTLKRLFNL